VVADVEQHDFTAYVVGCCGSREPEHDDGHRYQRAPHRVFA
jgi:hypothetical protein